MEDASLSYLSSTYIPVVGLDSITLDASTAEGDAAGYAFYDDTYQFLFGGGYISDVNENGNWELKVPDNATYFRFSEMENHKQEGYVKADSIPIYDTNICFEWGV